MAKITQHYYSWEDRFSTDPRFDWPSLPKMRVLCNGVECDHVVRCLTGDPGFVQFRPVKPSGDILLRETRIVTGSVSIVGPAADEVHGDAYTFPLYPEDFSYWTEVAAAVLLERGEPARQDRVELAARIADKAILSRRKRFPANNTSEEGKDDA